MTSREDLVDRALDTLTRLLTLTEVAAIDSHVALEVGGLADPEAVDALGMYLVALLAGIVGTDLRLSAALLEDSADAKAELMAAVVARLEPVPDAKQEIKDVFAPNVRDPWIAEGVAHALLAVRQRAVTPCVSGNVAAIAVPHPKPSQQGLDLFAIYDDAGLPALALGEAKATKNNGSGRLTEATSFFQKVHDGARDVDIRMQTVVLRPALSAQLQAGLSGAFWKTRACFLPFIAHGDQLDLARSRPGLKRIGRPVESKRVLDCHPVVYDEFFDAVDAAMRRAAAALYA
ncbi:hypothetical protein OJ997_03345 [Solirubrobacter phytolaccae]|uniref:Uncharacterized protein n=1 Tax=Solirubrobacter phytolaccae TaxID=1404360 RepID=A0A9X3N7X2_9ACTN|nr:hypothetical protein [Solirubrobacter phytolaccae]MDA0179321.1 hypothetical protein [Solirubrobacter phytolaccae]